MIWKSKSKEVFHEQRNKEKLFKERNFELKHPWKCVLNLYLMWKGWTWNTLWQQGIYLEDVLEKKKIKIASIFYD